MKQFASYEQILFSGWCYLIKEKVFLKSFFLLIKNDLNAKFTQIRKTHCSNVEILSEKHCFLDAHNHTSSITTFEIAVPKTDSFLNIFIIETYKTEKTNFIRS